MRDQQDFQDWLIVNQNRDDLRFRRRQVDIPGIPEKLEDLRSDIEHQIERFNNYMDGANRKIRVTARDNTDKALVAAQKVENGFYAMMDDFASQRSNIAISAYRRAIDQTTAKGVGIRHLAFAQEWRTKLFGKRLKGADDILKALDLGPEGFRSNPYVIEAPDVEAVFWEPDQSMFAEVGVKKISALRDLGDEDIAEYLNTYPEGITSETMDRRSRYNLVLPGPHVRTFHLETNEYIYDVIDASAGEGGFMVEYRENLAGRPLYVLTPGNLTSSRNVGEAFQPLVASVYPLAQRLGILGTLLNSSALHTGRYGHQLVAIGAQAISALDLMVMPEKERPTVEVNLTDEQIAHPPEGFKYELIPVPDQSILLQMYNDTKLEVQEKGFPPILDPSAVLKAESGYDRNQQTEAASLYLDPPLKNLASGDKELLLLIADISARLPVPIRLPVIDRAGSGDLRVMQQDIIEPDDWRDVDVQVVYQSVPLGAQSVQQEMDSRSVSEGVMSRETRMNRMYDDASAEEDRINSDRVRAVVAEKVTKDIATVLEQQAPAILEEELALAEVPLTVEEIGETLQTGDRRQRPVGNNSQGGTGAPVVPPVQSQNGQPQSGFETEVVS